MDKNSRLRSTLRRSLTNLCDLMILNLLWFVCSVPVITVGPATSALFAVTLRIAGEEPVSTFSEYFKAFKLNFRQSLVAGLIALFGAAVAYSDIVFGISQDGSTGTLFLTVSGIVIALWLVFTSYVFPLQARFENSLKGTIRNAFKLAFIAPGKTVLMWAVYAVPVLLAIFVPEAALRLDWAYLLLGVSGPVLITSKILRGIFSKVEDKKNESG